MRKIISTAIFLTVHCFSFCQPKIDTLELIVTTAESKRLFVKDVSMFPPEHFSDSKRLLDFEFNYNDYIQYLDENKEHLYSHELFSEKERLNIISDIEKHFKTKFRETERVEINGIDDKSRFSHLRSMLDNVEYAIYNSTRSYFDSQMKSNGVYLIRICDGKAVEKIVRKTEVAPITKRGYVSTTLTFYFDNCGILEKFYSNGKRESIDPKNVSALDATNWNFEITPKGKDTLMISVKTDIIGDWKIYSHVKLGANERQMIDFELNNFKPIAWQFKDRDFEFDNSIDKQAKVYKMEELQFEVIAVTNERKQKNIEGRLKYMIGRDGEYGTYNFKFDIEL